MSKDNVLHKFASINSVKIKIKLQYNHATIIYCPQFEKPGRRPNFDYPDMIKESVTKALADAKIQYREVDQACVGYVFGIITTACCPKYIYK